METIMYEEVEELTQEQIDNVVGAGPSQGGAGVVEDPETGKGCTETGPGSAFIIRF